MPAGSGHNQSPLRGELRHGGKRCFNLIQDLPLKALPFAVYPVELQGDLFGVAGITGGESGERYFRIAQPSGGIESGRNPEGEILGREGGEGKSCQFRDGRNPRPLGGPDLVQACLDEKPVLIKERGHVCHGSQSHQVEIVLQVRFGTGGEPPSFSKGRPQGHGQEKGQPHAGQMLERERTVGAVRIDHRAKGSEGLIHLMVIGDHHLQAEVCCKRDLLVVGYAAVHRDNQSRAAPGDSLYGFDMESVSFGQPIRDIGVHRDIECRKEIEEKGCCREPVRVIVPVDGDRVMPVHR